MKSIFAGSRVLLLGLAGLLLFAAPKARADEPTDQNDPPSRVARLSYLDGSVSFQPNGTEDWAAAVRNRPVTIGDKLWVDKDSRAELQAGEASIHLGSMTALSFLNLDDNMTQMRLAEGAINFRVRELREGDVYEVDTPNLAFTVTQAGAFRIDVDENGENTRIIAIRGEGQVTAAGQTYDVHAGEMAEFNGVDNPEYHSEAAPRPDDLDHWAADRDLKEEHSESARYVSRDVPGYSDLDDYGSWREEPDYGPVWYPTTVEVGWAPYSYGYWNWVGPWGWTWVDYAPWGFAPFHYGRWAFVGGAWGWCPGPYYARPFYGPAYVGWLGGGFGVGVGFGVGWFPLGWGEAYHPWYRASNVYINRVNITNTRINNVGLLRNTVHTNYIYAHNTRAVTTTSREGFVNGQAVNRGAMRVNEASLRNARVTNSVGLTPTKASFTGAAAVRGRVSTPPSSVVNRSVMARTAPAAAASHMPVRTMNTTGLSAGRVVNRSANTAPNRTVANGNFGGRGASANAPATSNHAGSSNRPPSASVGANSRANANAGASANRPLNNGRNWSAQGNATDGGRGPQGAGASSRPNNSAASGSNSSQIARSNHSDRPPWAGSGSTGGSRSSAPTYSSNRPSASGNRSYQPPARSSGSSNSNRPPASYSNGNRSYQPPSRSYSAPSRSYSAPSRSYSAPSRSYSAPPSYSAPSRSYSAPSRSYSAPSRSYSAPSRSYSAPSHSYGGGGGGGSFHGGGGGGSHSSGGGGGGSHGGGGGSHGGGGGSHGGGSHGRG